jgi:hypothetical protein
MLKFDLSDPISRTTKNELIPDQYKDLARLNGQSLKSAEYATERELPIDPAVKRYFQMVGFWESQIGVFESGDAQQPWNRAKPSFLRAVEEFAYPMLQWLHEQQTDPTITKVSVRWMLEKWQTWYNGLHTSAQAVLLTVSFFNPPPTPPLHVTPDWSDDQSKHRYCDIGIMIPLQSTHWD